MLNIDFQDKIGVDVRYAAQKSQNTSIIYIGMINDENWFKCKSFINDCPCIKI